MYRTRDKNKLGYLAQIEALGLAQAQFELKEQRKVEREAREDLTAAQTAAESFILRFGDYEECFEAINEGLGGNFAGTTSEVVDILQTDCLLFPSDGRAYSVFKHYGQALIAASIATSDRKDWETCVRRCQVKDMKEAKRRERKERKERGGE